jgi:YcxB-like protein
MRVRYTLSEGDYLEARAKHRGFWAKLLPVAGWIILVPYIIFVLIALVLRIFAHVTFAGTSGMYSISAGPIVLGLCMVFGQKLLDQASFRQDERLRNEVEADISDSEICISIPTTISKYTWAAFTRYVESKNLFLLYETRRTFNVIPKRAFSQSDCEAFRSLLREKLGSASAQRRSVSFIEAIAYALPLALVIMLLVKVILHIPHDPVLPK